MKLVPGCKVEYPADEFIHSEGNIEHLWNLSIKKTMKTKNNKPDLIIWNSEKKLVKWQNLVVPQTSIFLGKSPKRRIYMAL